MNVVTTGNAAVSVSACIVGLLFIVMRPNVLESTRFAVLIVKRNITHRIGVPTVGNKPELEPQGRQVFTETSQPQDDQELVDA